MSSSHLSGLAVRGITYSLTADLWEHQNLIVEGQAGGFEGGIDG